jgi:hypothetical protein
MECSWALADSVEYFSALCSSVGVRGGEAAPQRTLFLALRAPPLSQSQKK